MNCQSWKGKERKVKKMASVLSPERICVEKLSAGDSVWMELPE